MSAIKIPSKKIYNNEHSLAKNQINKIDAKSMKLDFKREYDETILSYRYDFTEDFIQKCSVESKTTVYDGNAFRYRKVDLYLLNDFGETDIVSNSGKTRIVSVARDNIDYTFSGVQTEDAHNWNFYDNLGRIEHDKMPQTDSLIPPAKEDLHKYPEESYYGGEHTYDIDEIPLEYGVPEMSSSAAVVFDDNDDISVSFGGPPNKITALTKKRVMAIEVVGSGEITKDGKYAWSLINYRKYEPKEYLFSLVGDVESYEEETQTVGYGDGEDYYKIETNELMLDVATINGVPVTQVIAENIIDGFKNGKETYSLVCSIGDYYDENGTLAISDKTQIDGKNKMMFDIGDTVIPYKPSASGDVVISSSSNGTFPKMFKVVGVTPIFDGAVWQKLDLLETNTMEKNVTIEAIEERIETIVQALKPVTSTNTNTMSISLPSNVDSVKIIGANISREEELNEREQIIETQIIDDKNNYSTFASFVDGVLSIRTMARSTDVRVIKEPSASEDGEFICEFAEVPEREYLFELHMS